jgi:TfuA protein
VYPFALQHAGDPPERENTGRIELRAFDEDANGAFLERICVFAGPSLPPADRLTFPGVTYAPPAARGDVARAAEIYDTILLLDGVFHHELAPTPKEVLAAVRRVRLYGAASMGALRAVECRPYGAVALGAIARWYERGTIDGDDEVAVAMHPETHVALSVASVNVRYVAWLAVRRGILDRAAARDWVDKARTAIYYAERSWPGAVACAPAAAQSALLEIARSEGDLKRWDARFALRRVLHLRERRRALA